MSCLHLKCSVRSEEWITARIRSLLFLFLSLSLSLSSQFVHSLGLSRMVASLLVPHSHITLLYISHAARRFYFSYTLLFCSAAYNVPRLSNSFTHQHTHNPISPQLSSCINIAIPQQCTQQHLLV